MSARTRNIRGVVEEAEVSVGSKSQRKAVVLLSGGDRMILRRKGGNPFKDPSLSALVGKHICASGTLLGKTLVLDGWEIEEPEG